MFFPKILSFTLLFLSKTNLIHSSDINKNISNKIELSQTYLEKKEIVDCTAICYRPVSNKDTCEKYGSESIGCLNYKRCLEKCEDNKKSNNNSKHDKLD